VAQCHCNNQTALRPAEPVEAEGSPGAPLPEAGTEVIAAADGDGPAGSGDGGAAAGGRPVAAADTGCEDGLP